MIGVYLITNAITGAKYVGQSRDIKRRVAEHRTPNASLRSKSERFVRDIVKYGIDSFMFEVLEECPADRLLATEKKWIDVINPEYNTVGRGIAAETRRKISNTLKRHPTDARLQNIARRAQLAAVMIIAREQRDLAAPNANIIADRQTDCRYCDHSPPCARCKYASPAARIDTIRRHIGQEALDCIEKYAKTKGD